jgi:hypothetical protein
VHGLVECNISGMVYLFRDFYLIAATFKYHHILGG